MTTLRQSDIGITFTVSDVEPSAELMPAVRHHEAIEALVGSEIESCSSYHQPVLSQVYCQPFLSAVYTAYSLHYPLVLSPDAVWLTIVQGIAYHMAVEGERLRNRFVDHQGQLTLTLETDGWIPGSPENPWADAFEYWADEIRNHVGEELWHTLVTDFSTTGTTERSVSHILMMDVFQRFFQYRVVGICGLPSVTLRGTSDDWGNLRCRVDRLRIFDIDWWLDHLVPICDQFAEASQGNIDRTHWNNICKLENAYGGDVINGWVAGMFPYLREFPGGPCTRRNPIFSTGKGFQTYLAPSGLSQVPMTWRSASGQERCMEVLGGLTGVQQDPDSLALEPIAGWAVRCADQLDQLLLRLKNEHVTVPTPPRSVTSNEDQSPERSFLSDRYPPDLGRFYYQFTHAVIADEHKCHIRILPFDQITGIDWGEGPCLGSRGPDGHTWYRFAELSDGRWLAINLDCNRFQLESESWESDDTTFDPICLSSESTVGCLSANPVVAWNFQEWLQRTLDHGTTSQETAWYWDDVDFEPLDDAASLIRADKGW